MHAQFDTLWKELSIKNIYSLTSTFFLNLQNPKRQNSKESCLQKIYIVTAVNMAILQATQRVVLSVTPLNMAMA